MARDVRYPPAGKPLCETPWRWIIPTSILYDALFGLLAFGAATANAPEGPAPGIIPAAVAMMFLCSFTMLGGHVLFLYREYVRRCKVE